MNNNIHYKVWDEITVALLTFGNEWISLHTLLGMWLFIYALISLIKLIHVYKRSSRCLDQHPQKL